MRLQHMASWFLSLAAAEIDVFIPHHLERWSVLSLFSGRCFAQWSICMFLEQTNDKILSFDAVASWDEMLRLCETQHEKKRPQRECQLSIWECFHVKMRSCEWKHDVVCCSSAHPPSTLGGWGFSIWLHGFYHWQLQRLMFLFLTTWNDGQCWVCFLVVASPSEAFVCFLSKPMTRSFRLMQWPVGTKCYDCARRNMRKRDRSENVNCPSIYT